LRAVNFMNFPQDLGEVVWLEDGEVLGLGLVLEGGGNLVVTGFCWVLSLSRESRRSDTLSSLGEWLPYGSSRRYVSLVNSLESNMVDVRVGTRTGLHRTSRRSGGNASWGTCKG